LNYFENENKKIKKIACGCSDPHCFFLFITGYFLLKIILKIKIKNLIKKFKKKILKKN
jgi:hypothetical protein